MRKLGCENCGNKIGRFVESRGVLWCDDDESISCSIARLQYEKRALEYEIREAKKRRYEVEEWVSDLRACAESILAVTERMSIEKHDE